MKSLAGNGDDRAAAALRSSRTKRPDLWDAHRIPITEQARESWLELYGGSDPGDEYARVAMRHDAIRLREELLAGSDDALDGMMVDRIIAAHLACVYHETMYAQAAKREGTTYRTLDYHAAKAATVQRQFLQACETFARVRRLRGPAVAVSIGAVNVAATAATPDRAVLPEPDPSAAAIEGTWRTVDKSSRLPATG